MQLLIAPRHDPTPSSAVELLGCNLLHPCPGAEDPDITEALGAARRETLATLLAGLREWDESPVGTEPSAALEIAAQGWLFFVEGALLRWLEYRDLERRQLRAMFATAFIGALNSALAAGAPGPAGDG